MLRQILAVQKKLTKNSNFVTLAGVKAELDIKDGTSDDILKTKIAEASDDIEAALGFSVPSATVLETFWHGRSEPFDAPEYILMKRTPVSAIASVVRDDVTIDATRYRLDPETGQLYHLNESGFPWPWFFCKSLQVTYTGGYLLPDDDDCNLPPGIIGATLELVSDFWAAKGRDPSIKTEEVFGVDRTDYWVGTVGDPSELPPRVLMKLTPFRRPQI